MNESKLAKERELRVQSRKAKHSMFPVSREVAHDTKADKEYRLATRVSHTSPKILRTVKVIRNDSVVAVVKTARKKVIKAAKGFCPTPKERKRRVSKVISVPIPVN